MRKYNIGLCGYGVVGKGMHKFFEDEVIAIYDPNFSDSNKQEDFKNLDLVIICVPTNATETGHADTSIVEDSVRWLGEIGYIGTILIKSTTPPLVLKALEDNAKRSFNLDVVFSPEFLGESSYFTPYWKYADPTDMKKHTWQIFGGEKHATQKCVDIFKRYMSVDTRFFQTDIKTAGLVKYMENCFFATKVTFVNEWYDIAQAYGVNFDELREMWLADERINRNHTMVFKDSRGYGGKCFPKDVKALIADVKKLNMRAELLQAVDKVNERIRNESI